MGKQAGPSPEELEFIFECFTRGLSDREVLEEMQGTECLVRTPRFVRDRRREFNAARTVLEITLKQQIDPIHTKAKEEHLIEVRNLIKQWIDVLKPIPLYEITYEIPFPTESLESDPIFDCLREHVPSEQLWKDYVIWTTQTGDYISRSQSLINDIRKQGSDLSKIIGPLLEEECKIEQPILKTIHMKAQGKESMAGRIFSTSMGLQEPLSMVSIRGYNFTLWDSDVDSFLEQYRAIEEHFLACEKSTNLIAILRELESVEFRIRRTLLEVLTSRTYHNYSCRLCPGQGK